ncbi:MAG: hypothetical protein K8W52_43335 [Deltaproteobacteria bacterium]|nr:hypothetical protein [Deltaproteobacteria bacterium]
MTRPIRAALALLALTACTPHPTGLPPAPRAPTGNPAKLDDAMTLADLGGTWAWEHTSLVDGAQVTERERWHLEADPTAPGPALHAHGAYDREVVVTATDGVPFSCAQDTTYRQRARYDVVVEIADGAIAIRETGYHTEPGPCEHGFRAIGHFEGALRGNLLRLRWDGGEQVLARAGTQPLPAQPAWAGLHPTWDGSWTWTVHTMDDGGDLRDEQEDWRIAIGADQLATATYVRTVTTRSRDGRPIACAGARRWTYVDRYTLEGHLDRDVLTLTEVASDAGRHPCLAPTPRRSLDAATAQLDGDFAIFEWRGKRRQVLHRPRASH